MLRRFRDFFNKAPLYIPTHTAPFHNYWNKNAKTPTPTKPVYQDMPIKELIETCDSGQITKYEDTRKYNNSGALALNRKHSEYQREIEDAEHSIVSTYTPRVTLNNVTGIMLTISEESVIPSSRQMHIVVVIKDETLTAVGILTSSKAGDNAKLSEDQPLSGNKDKAQNIMFFKRYLILNQNDFKEYTAATEYLRSDAVYKAFVKEINKRGDREVVQYKQQGVTGKHLELLLEKNDLKKSFSPEPKKLSPELLAQQQNRSKKRNSNEASMKKKSEETRTNKNNHGPSNE